MLVALLVRAVCIVATCACVSLTPVACGSGTSDHRNNEGLENVVIGRKSTCDVSFPICAAVYFILSAVRSICRGGARAGLEL